MEVKDMEPGDVLRPVPTKASHLLNDKTIEFRAVQFVQATNNFKSNLKGTCKQPTAMNAYKSKELADKQDQSTDFDIKRARYEIINFAAKDRSKLALSKREKKLKQQQMMWIGTKVKHLKNPYENYKELLAKRKHEKQQRYKLGKFQQLGKNQNGMSVVKCNSKRKLINQNRKRAPVSNIDQNYGTIIPKIKGKLK